MTEGPTHKDEDRALAAEYALDLLTKDERQAFRERLAWEPDLHRLVAEWQEDLAALADEVEEVKPPVRVWRGVERRLSGSAPIPRKRGLSLWKMLSGMASGLAVALIALALVAPVKDPTPGFAPAFTAEIEAPDSGIRLVARTDPAQRELRVERVSGAAPEGRVLELWVIVGDAEPQSLGVLPDAALATIEIPAPLLSQLEGAVLAISEEPPGGAPYGQPTGRILGAGVVAPL